MVIYHTIYTFQRTYIYLNILFYHNSTSCAMVLISYRRPGPSPGPAPAFILNQQMAHILLWSTLSSQLSMWSKQQYFQQESKQQQYYFLVLIGICVCLYFPTSFLVMWNSCIAASSASFARLPIKSSLSVFTVFLTALFASVLVLLPLPLQFDCSLVELSFPFSLALC